MSVDTYYKRNLAAMDEKIKKSIADSDAVYDNQAKTTKEKYGAQIDLAGQEYDDLARTNEVQKYINMREVAENNANLGLTDSGLNRTQSTAVQLSASNNAAKIERDRTDMVNTLTAEMNAYLTEIENNKISSAASIRKGYEDSAMSAAVDQYEADVDAAAKKYKTAANVSVERLEEISDEIEKIKVDVVKGRKDENGVWKEGYDIKRIANDRINERLNELVDLGYITEDDAITIYKNNAYKNV